MFEPLVSSLELLSYVAGTQVLPNSNTDHEPSALNNLNLLCICMCIHTYTKLQLKRLRNNRGTNNKERKIWKRDREVWLRVFVHDKNLFLPICKR